jgi:tRNA (guanine-N7-)-methyltransferase
MTEIDPIPEQNDDGQGDVQRVLYGRRVGRPLRPLRQALVDNLLPSVEVVTPNSGESVTPGLQFSTPYEAYWLEIGFGAGEHLAWQARANPNVGIIGCEPYLNGVARLLADMDKCNLTNIRIFRDDARFLLAGLPDASISRIFVLFPDPWPKSRHHKRRVVGPSVMPDLARILCDGAELRIATDDPGYKGWILQHVLATSNFDWFARRPSDWRQRPVDWPPTRYEQRAKSAGRCAAFFRFARRSRVV